MATKFKSIYFVKTNFLSKPKQNLNQTKMPELKEKEMTDALGVLGLSDSVDLEAEQEKELQILQNIEKVKKDLEETYNLFITARDFLSNISFKKAQNNFKKDSEKLINSKNMSDDEIDKNMSAMPNMKIGSVPELSSFFDVISNLKIGMSKMEEADKMMRNLGETVIEASFKAEENTEAIKKELSLLDQEAVGLMTKKIENEEKKLNN